MRLKVLTCESLSREMFLAAAFSEHIIDFKFFSRKSHDEPEKMHGLLQAEIDRSSRPSDEANNCQEGIICPACSHEDYDYIVIGVGLCGNATADICARNIPLVIPKAHDCNTFLLGSREKFQEFIDEEPGTIFYHFGQVERSDIAKIDALPRSTGLGRDLSEYIEKYGEENAIYLKNIEYNWTHSHSRAAYLFPEIPSHLRDRKEAEVREYVKQFNWKVVKLLENKVFFSRLLGGNWDEEFFLVVEPGKHIVPSNNEAVLRSA